MHGEFCGSGEYRTDGRTLSEIVNASHNSSALNVLQNKTNVFFEILIIFVQS